MTSSHLVSPPRRAYSFPRLANLLAFRTLESLALRIGDAASFAKDEVRRRRAISRLLAKEATLPAATRPLPFVRVTGEALADQRFLLRHAQRGPYLRTWRQGRLTTYILVLANGRRFLSAHEADLGATTFDGTHLFPHGSLRQMEGDTHHHYRRVFAEAFRAVTVRAHTDAVDAIFDATAQRLTRGGELHIAEIRQILHTAATEFMVGMCLGLDRSDPRFDAVTAIYRDITTDHLVETFNTHRFERIRQIVEPLSREGRPSLLAHLAAGGLDDTALGNVALLIEVGRYDLVGLWVWLLKIVGDNPGTLESVVSHADEKANAISEAVVLEVLRLERSEYLHRFVRSDIVFDGLFIPARSIVRIAVWEAHKDPRHFPDPFRFDPRRFVGQRQPPDYYSPLGLDRHRCLGAEWVIAATAALVRGLARNCQMEILTDGHAERDRYHFAPSGQLRMRFYPR